MANRRWPGSVTIQRSGGRPSYHPLFCFNGITKDFWHGELRPSDTHTATGTVELLKAVFAKLPTSVKSVIIRADKGFYDHETIEYLESNKALFVIVAKLTSPVKRKISTLSYQVHSSGLETAEFMYQPTRWKKEYRFVVVRRLIPEDPSEQLTLFSMGKYSYQVVVTNMKLTPLHTWRFYNGRAAVELIIKELKGDYPLGKIPTKYFAANEAYFHTLLFSYNLINWFKRLCLPMEFQNMTLKSLRARLLLIPGELIKPDNRPTLKLLANFLYKHAFEYAIKKVENLKI
jgi:Transposase DDE domain group 1